MSHRTVRAALAAVAGTTVGAVAVAVPAHGSAAVATPAADEAAASLPICDGWTDFATNVNGRAAAIHIPTAGQGSGNVTCQLTQMPNNVLGGVFKLQTALNKCYGAGLDVDGRYGPATAGAVQTKIQRPHPSLRQDGVFEPNTSFKALWPVYLRSNGQATGECQFWAGLSPIR